MKHKKSYNSIIAVILLLAITYWTFYTMWSVPEFFRYSKPIYSLLVLGAIVVIIWNLWKIDYRHKYIDRMTGINNDAWMFSRGGSLYFRNKLNGYDCLFVNIKDCKYINQKVTNFNGDLVILIYANRLKDFLKHKGYIGRMGGDNFLVFIKDEYLEEFLDFLKVQKITIAHNGRDVELDVSARIGVCKVQSLDPKHEGKQGFRNVINCAAVSLSKAKEEFLDTVIFEGSIMDSFISDNETLQEVREAMREKAFVPYYQPKVDATTGKLCGAEGLVRWKKGDQIIMPGKFIPLLERNGEITDLDYLIFELVCADIKKWKEEGVEPVKVSTNFSRLHLSEMNFAERIIEIKNRYGVDSQYLEVELTESTEGKNLVALREFSKKMKQENISIAIDDFGTGYSSLSLIKNFDADVIKLDKSFIDSATKDDPVSRNFVRDIIRMIENLGEQTLCEGVEDKEQLEFLVEAGCNIIQGYYFDKPLPKEEFEKRLKNPMYKI